MQHDSPEGRAIQKGNLGIVKLLWSNKHPGENVSLLDLLCFVCVNLHMKLNACTTIDGEVRSLTSILR